jgi:hypothetical protein
MIGNTEMKTEAELFLKSVELFQVIVPGSDPGNGPVLCGCNRKVDHISQML